MSLLTTFNILLLIYGTCSAFSNQEKIDAYVDAVIEDVYEQFDEAKLDPYPLEPFEVRAPIAYLYHLPTDSERLIEANVTRGRIEGLRNIGRRGHCRVTLPPAPERRTSDITISCNVTLVGVKAVILNGTVRGDLLTENARRFTPSLVISDGDMNVVIVGRSGLGGHLTRAKMSDIRPRTIFQNPEEELRLKYKESRAFSEQFDWGVAKQFFKLAESPLTTYLYVATARKVIPYLDYIGFLNKRSA